MNSLKFEERYVQKLWDTLIAARCDTSLLDPLYLDEIAAMYNGIGAEWMPESVRAFITGINPTLEPAALVHDVWWARASERLTSERTKDDFLESNATFEHNGIMLAKKKYGWYDPRRYIVILQAKKYRKILDAFGWGAYERG